MAMTQPPAPAVALLPPASTPGYMMEPVFSGPRYLLGDFVSTYKLYDEPAPSTPTMHERSYWG